MYLEGLNYQAGYQPDLFINCWMTHLPVKSGIHENHKNPQKNISILLKLLSVGKWKKNKNKKRLSELKLDLIKVKS